MSVYLGTSEVNLLGGQSRASGEPYTGSYEVTPRVYAQSLDTDGKLMSNDVTVHEIPVTATSNLDGGLTVLIG